MAVIDLKAMLSELLLSHPKLWFFAKETLRSIRQRGDIEERLVPFLIRTNGVAVDVGANRGIYTQIMLSRTRNVISIEPNPELARVLERLFRQNVRVIAGAASNANGSAVLRIPYATHGLATIEPKDHSFPGDFKTVNVKTFKIDDLGLEDVTFIKVDVEGHELSVLEGALQLLERDRPSLLLEAEERHQPGAVERVRALLEPIGYEGYMFERGALVSVRRFEAAVHQSFQAAEERRLSGLPGIYINNFIFLPSGASLCRVSAGASNISLRYA